MDYKSFGCEKGWETLRKKRGMPGLRTLRPQCANRYKVAAPSHTLQPPQARLLTKELDKLKGVGRMPCSYRRSVISSAMAAVFLEWMDLRFASPIHITPAEAAGGAEHLVGSSSP